MRPDHGRGRVSPPHKVSKTDLGLCSQDYGEGIFIFRPLFGGRKERREKYEYHSSPQCGEHRSCHYPHGREAEFTHRQVGQAERLACRKRQPTQFPGGSPDPLYCQRKEKLGPGRAGSAIPPCVAPVRLRVRRLGAGQPCTNKRRHKATVRPLWAKGGNRKLVPRELRIFHF